MTYFKRISGSTWGPTLIQMRWLFLSKVRPIIGFGCAVWYLYGRNVKWAISQKLICGLESLQYQCLIQITGAYKRTSRQYLLKERHIELIALYLYRTATAFRARTLDSQDAIFLNEKHLSSITFKSPTDRNWPAQETISISSSTSPVSRACKTCTISSSRGLSRD